MYVRYPHPMYIYSASDLRVGDVGFSIIGGRVGWWVTLGQHLIDFVSRDQSWWTHTYIVTEVDPVANVARIVEAMPGGARETLLSGTQRCGEGFGWVRIPDLAQGISVTARAFVGTPYSFLDYLSLALLHLGLPRGLVAKRVTDSGHMICSQLVDQVLTRSGVRVFDDGRMSQDVTPGALFRRLGAKGQATWR